MCDAAMMPGCRLAPGVLGVYSVLCLRSTKYTALVWLGTPCMNHSEAKLVTGDRADKQIRPLSFSAQSYPFQCRPRICRSLPQNSNFPTTSIGPPTRAQRPPFIASHPAPSSTCLGAWVELSRNARLFPNWSVLRTFSAFTSCQPVSSALRLVVNACARSTPSKFGYCT